MDLLKLDAIAQAELVASRAVTPAELLEAAIARAEAVDPRLNFLAQRLFDEARSAARNGGFSGPFAGVPFLVKDLNCHIEGAPSGQGSNLFRDYRADHSSEIYRRFLGSGLNVFGKTTTPEFGLTVTTESRATGLTRNPWDPARSAGGSSGGAAVAVATGVVPFAHASDGGGSIRCPASACGVFGLKPSRGRTPSGPKVTEGWFGLSLNHAVSRTVRDSAALLDAIAGPEPGSRYIAPPPERPLLSEVGRDPGRLRVAVMRRPITGVPVDPQVDDALTAAARLLEGLGHHVEEAAPPLEAPPLTDAMVTIIAACTAAEVGQRLAELGRDSAGDDIEPVTQMFVHIGRTTGADRLAAANDALQGAAITVAEFMRQHDIILSPVFAQPPIELGRIDLSPPDIATWTANITGYSPFTALYNWTGQPAMSLPLGWSRDGLPIGIMAAARYGEEGPLFRLAGQLEQAAPWADRLPAL